MLEANCSSKKINESFPQKNLLIHGWLLIIAYQGIPNK
jgi:hypothetical protein